MIDEGSACRSTRDLEEAGTEPRSRSLRNGADGPRDGGPGGLCRASATTLVGGDDAQLGALVVRAGRYTHGACPRMEAGPRGRARGGARIVPLRRTAAHPVAADALPRLQQLVGTPSPL